MYDDHDDPRGWLDQPGDYRDQGFGEDPRFADGHVHLCPECREVMTDVVRAWDRLPQPAPEPDWSRALRWLDTICGGRQAVLDLDTRPLEADGPAPGGEPTGAAAERLERVEGMLDVAAGQFAGDEVPVAFRRGLRRCFERQPGVVMAPRAPELLALGVVWAVGHANGLLWPRGQVTEKALRDQLGATQSGSTTGSKVERALVGPFSWGPAGLPWEYAVGGWRDRGLKALGHPDLLVSTCRRQLVDVRDRALGARRAAQEAA